MTSISAHGQLVHVVMNIRSLTGKSITSLVKNSPKLITLHLHVTINDMNLEHFNATLKKLFWNRRLFAAGLYELVVSWDINSMDVLWEQGTDLLLLWP